MNQNEIIKNMSEEEKKALMLVLAQQTNTQLKITKELSEVFYSKKDNAMSKFKNLSETKKYYEVNHLNILKAYMTKHALEYMTSQDFHKMLSELMTKIDLEVAFN